MTDNELKLIELDKTVRENEIVRQINENRRNENEAIRQTWEVDTIKGYVDDLCDDGTVVELCTPVINAKIDEDLGAYQHEVAELNKEFVDRTKALSDTVAVKSEEFQQTVAAKSDEFSSKAELAADKAASLEAQYQQAASALTVDSEVQLAREGGTHENDPAASLKIRLDDDYSQLSGEIDELQKDIGRWYGSFAIASGDTHSSMKDRIKLNIPAGTEFTVNFSGDTGRSSVSLFAVYADNTSENVSPLYTPAYTKKLVAEKDIVALGIYCISDNDTVIKFDVQVDGIASRVDNLEHDASAVYTELLGISNLVEKRPETAKIIDSTSRIKTYPMFLTGGSVISTTFDDSVAVYVYGFISLEAAINAYTPDGSFGKPVDLTWQKLPDAWSVGNALTVPRDSYVIILVRKNPDKSGITLDYLERVKIYENTGGYVDRELEIINKAIDSSSIDALGFMSKRFDVKKGVEHSSTLDKIYTNIPANTSVTLRANTTAGSYSAIVFVTYSDGTYENVGVVYFGDEKGKEITRSKNIVEYGLYISTIPNDGTVDYSITVSNKIYDKVMRDKTVADIVSMNQDAEASLVASKRRLSTGENDASLKPKVATLLHFSDIHGHSDALKRIIEYKNAYANYINDAICTGDVVTDTFNDSMDYWNGATGSENILLAIGNHDVVLDKPYDWSHLATIDQTSAKYIEPYSANWGAVTITGKSYYYKDYADSNLRMIVLDSMLAGADMTAQNEWLESTLASAKTAGYSIVIAEHYPARNPVKVDTTFTCITRGSGTSVMYTLATEYQATVQDFIDNGGDFVCYLAGHTHNDYIEYNEEYPDQYFVVVDCANPSYQSYYYSDTERDTGTKSEDLFNLVSIDTYTKTLKIIRVGADKDLYLRSKKALSLNYSTKQIIVNN